MVSFFGILASFWAYLVVSYDIGANPGLGSGGYNLLRAWLYYPTETNIPAVAFMGVGFLFTGFLWWLRTPFPDVSVFTLLAMRWRVVCGHSAGFGFPVLISWAIKNLILRFGGIRLYHKVLPLFLGLILGQFIVGGTWVLIRLIWRISVYSFYR